MYLWRTPACNRIVFYQSGACYRKRLPYVRGALMYKRQSQTEWHQLHQLQQYRANFHYQYIVAVKLLEY